MVWLDARVSFSSAERSSSRNTDHHSPLPRASLGALSRQGSATSQCVAAGAEARWYFGPTVQPARQSTATSAASARWNGRFTSSPRVRELFGLRAGWPEQRTLREFP